MANYKETDLVGVSWIRCRNITITNPMAGTIDQITKQPNIPTAYFQEEKVISIDGTKTFIDIGNCSKKFTPTEVINLRDPDTGELTGATSSHSELYKLLNSLYLQTALERDQANTSTGSQ